MAEGDAAASGPLRRCFFKLTGDLPLSLWTNSALRRNSNSGDSGALNPGHRLRSLLRNRPHLRRWAPLALLLALCVSILPLFSQDARFVGKPIRDIEFRGLRNVSIDDLLPLLSSQVGENLEESNYNRDVRALFQTGFFSDVVMRARLSSDGGVELFFDVVELPRIRLVQYLGVDEIPVQDLRTVAGVREGDVFNLQRIKEAAAAIQRKYRGEGYLLAEVFYRIGEASGANRIDVSFVVDEGQSIPISRINIIGPRNLDPEEIRDALELKEESFLEDGVFDEAKFEEDKFKILAFAKSRGYLDAEIDPQGTGYEIRWRTPSRPEDGRVVIITYKLNEGEIRFFGGYSLEHDRTALNQELNPPERTITDPENQLRPIFKPEQLLIGLEYNNDDVGEIFDEGKLFRDRGYLQEAYSSQGYVFAQIQPATLSFKLDEATVRRYEECLPRGVQDACGREASWMNLPAMREALSNPELAGRTFRHIHFIVRENGLAYIENIIIKGNQKTQEYVIRRELLMKEGQLFNSALVNRSREKLINLGYFKEVNLQMRPGSADDRMNLIIDVEEQPTGTISLGGGYGTQSGFSIFTEVGENNLNGTGQRISGRLEYGPNRRTLGMEWSDPWFYESCADNTGSFWRNKLKDIDGASDLVHLLVVADSFQNEFTEIGVLMRSYVEEAGGDRSVEALDRVKARSRALIRGFVAREEECYRSFPQPWALRLGAFYQSIVFEDASPLPISFDANDLFEPASFERNRFGLEIGISHSFLVNWAHYHIYSPSWSTASRPTSLSNDQVLSDVALGWQFKSSLTNGVVYNTVDNVFNPTEGFRLNSAIETVGGLLGGQDHFNRYSISTSYYFWWFDYTFGGLFRKNILKRWRVVQELRLRGIFTHETAPASGSQDKSRNPFIEAEDRLFLGGYNQLRGYDFTDSKFPRIWQSGGSHQLLGGVELRFPIEPSILWLVAFFDGGALYNNVGEYIGDDKTAIETYEQQTNLLRASSDPLIVLLNDTRDPSVFWTRRWHFDSFTDWNDPYRSVFSARNVALDRALYSWGFGLRVQIPVLPLRLFVAQKLYYSHGRLRPIPGDDEFQFVFGIGDQRF
ncbi:MAG: BamA/TamA family outer membrane protein [Leptospirales bacterium]|nr:BamA/TamA family outer membrane protein [Leptospirales bacterium]